ECSYNRQVFLKNRQFQRGRLLDFLLDGRGLLFLVISRIAKNLLITADDGVNYIANGTFLPGTTGFCLMQVVVRQAAFYIAEKPIKGTFAIRFGYGQEPLRGKG